jgi:hypothetical protein
MKSRTAFLIILAGLPLSVVHAGAQRWHYKSETTSLGICNDSIGILKLTEEGNARAIEVLSELPFNLGAKSIISTLTRMVLVQVDISQNQPELLIDENGKSHLLTPLGVQRS